MTTQTQTMTAAQDQRAAYTAPTVTQLCLIETALISKSGPGTDFTDQADASLV